MASRILSHLKALVQSTPMLRFLSRRFLALAGGAPIRKVPLDVFLDGIFPYLTIEDILSLRRVDKGFYLLTHEPIVWKRFLERMNFPIPAFRPSFRYNLDATDYEIEQLVTRAITADDTWRSHKPFIWDRMAFEKYNRVTDMFILPGGKYMFSSCHTQDKSKYYIVLYMLDHPHGPRSLCRIPVASQVHGLQAKFMDLYDGEQGLVLSYIRRKFQQPEMLPKGAQTSDYSHKHPTDVPGGWSYEIRTIYTSLSMMEYMSSPAFDQSSPDYLKVVDLMPCPFRQLNEYCSKMELRDLSLFETPTGNKMLAFMRGATQIIFVNVQNIDERACLTFPRHPFFAACLHRVRAFRIYPHQNNLVVIQTVTRRPEHETDHIISWFPMPSKISQKLEEEVACMSRFTIHKKSVYKFHISDYGLPGRKPVADHPKLRHSVGPPPPMSIYAEMRAPRGVEHIGLYPKQSEALVKGKKQYTYTYEHEGYQMSSHVTRSMIGPRIFLCGGAERAVLFYIDPEDRTDSPKLISMRRYVHPQHGTLNYEDDPAGDAFPDENVLRKGRLPLPKTGVYRTIETGDALDEVNRLGGAKAVCFDESTGRVCIAPDQGGILVLEGSHQVMPGARHKQWKEENMHLFPELPEPVAKPAEVL